MDIFQSGVSLLLLAVIGVAVIMVVMIIVAAFALYSRRRKTTLTSQQPPLLTQNVSTAQTQPITPIAAPYGIQSAQDLVATLVILASDNPAMVGSAIHLSSRCTTIGNGPANDITLALDKLVSHQHALLEMTNTALFVSEIAIQEAGDHVRRPTYGTFVNEQQIGSIPVQLKPGDVIRLGSRFMMRFDSLSGQQKMTP